MTTSVAIRKVLKTVNEKAIPKGEVNKKLVQLGSVDTCLITKIRVVINVENTSWWYCNIKASLLFNFKFKKMNYKIDEKRFLESCIISNTNGLLASDWFNPSEPNYNQISDFSVSLALEQLKFRNELFGTEKKVKAKKEEFSVDIEEIINIFNSVCFVLPIATKPTKERENAILKILETYSMEDIGNVFKLVAESDYLCGKKVDWKADFDWIFVPKNFIKILENNYKNIENGNSNKSKSDSDLKESAIDAVNAMFGVK